jgi:hydrogenase-4 component E
VNSLLDLGLILVLLCGFCLLGSGRFGFGIQVMAAQGFVLGMLAPLTSPEGLSLRTTSLVVLAVTVKAIVLPRLLRWALRDAEVRTERRPIVGFKTSLMAGVVMLVLAFWINGRLTLPTETVAPLHLPTALFTVQAGLFLIVARNKALSQVLGYQLLENGIYLCGLALAPEEPLLIELGVLLDVLVGVLVMGVAIFHINRAFDTIDVGRLRSLKD